MAIDNFNSTIDKWIFNLQNYDLESIILKSDNDSWSMGQLYRHILEETKWYMGQIQLCLSNSNHVTEQIKDNKKQMFLNNEFPNQRFKGDPFISKNVQQPNSILQLQTELEELKLQINALWSQIQQSEITGKSAHPGLGYLGPQEWVQYAEMHLRHHLKQKERITNTLSLRAAANGRI